MTLTRPDNWQIMLSQYLERASAFGFSWGENDCLFFASNWVEQLTGLEFVADLRGKWSTEKGAIRFLRRLDFATYLDFYRARMDGIEAVEVTPENLHRGDICFMASDNAFGGALGIVADHRCAFLTDNQSAPLLLVDRQAITLGWRISCP